MQEHIEKLKRLVFSDQEATKEFWLTIRQACIMVAAAIEKRYNLKRTMEPKQKS